MIVNRTSELLNIHGTLYIPNSAYSMHICDPFGENLPKQAVTTIEI